MKILSDIFPVLLFFLTYFVGKHNAQAAHELALTVLGPIVRNGTIPVDLAPMLLASAVAIGISALQIAWRLVRRLPVGFIHWLTFALFLVFGGATIYLADDTYIRWKPTVLFWSFAVVFWASEALFGRNIAQLMLADAGVQALPVVWRRLNWSWIAFFLFVGALNLYVAFSLSREVWVSFKFIGLTGLTVVFAFGQAIFLSRYMEPEAGAKSDPTPPGA